MSVINIFLFSKNGAIFIGGRAACRCSSREEVSKTVVRAPRIAPQVVPRWSVEKDLDGTTHLVRHWFENNQSNDRRAGYKIISSGVSQ